MPISYAIDQDLQRIHTRCVGNTTVQEVIEHFETLVNDPTRPPSLDVLLDLSEMTTIPDSGQLHLAAAATLKARLHVQFHHCAIVTASETTRGLAMVWEMFARQAFRATSVFRNTGEARAWLDASRVEE